MAGAAAEPRGVLGTVAEQRVTVLSAVPTFWSQLARYLERHPEPDALASVRLAVSSGDSLPAAVAERLREVTGVDLIEGLGCSECSNIVISTRPGEPFRPGVLGRPVEGVEVKLADEDGEPVARGEPGRLWIRSDSNTSGYWRREEETRDLVVGPWLRMGDMLDGGRGRAHAPPRPVGRPVQGRRALGQPVAGGGRPADPPRRGRGGGRRPGRRRRPDAPGGARRARAGAAGDDDLAAELRRHVARALAPHMAPQSVTVRESLPRLPSGKLDRRGAAGGVNRRGRCSTRIWRSAVSS